MVSSPMLLAQQKAQYTQYIINNYIVNPALSGIENYTDIKLAHRNQWVGLSGAPVTSYATIHTPIGKQDYKTHAGTIFSMGGENMRGKDIWNEYVASPSHHGIGLQINNDRNGPFNNFSLMGTYAYHMHLSAKTNLSAGIGIGLSKYSINTNKLFFGIDNPVDPSVFGSGIIGKTNLDINAGLWLYSNRYYVGGAALQIVPNKIDFSQGVAQVIQGKYAPHLFLTAGYGFFPNNDVFVVPSIMIKKIDPVPLQVDLNVKTTFKEVVWVGASYRHLYGMAGMAGIRATDNVMISYSYDYSFTKINKVSTGSHEIIVSIGLGNEYSSETQCPNNLW